MDNLLYYVLLQNNSIQPIIVRQPSAVIIHTQPKLPVTLDLPPQNIILKSEDPQPIIVRQQNPNIIIQKPYHEFYNNNSAVNNHCSSANNHCSSANNSFGSANNSFASANNSSNGANNGNINFSITENGKLNDLSATMYNTNTIEQAVKENINGINTIQHIAPFDPSYVYNNHNGIYENKAVPTDSVYYGNVTLNNEKDYTPYNTILYEKKHADYVNIPSKY
ncbi:hypothetical protein MKS88_004540 [Plasmodium brasilianum]|uniref:Pv-fam-g protein n=2 Tax=Plasmodium (Plasmodium) TaxID=418103 RepID=A0A1A8XA57_PLAMA|nr:hypothetical protein MKS88_004540 [Plasmodium brasilianum]SBT01156.1 conserved Plasmodium protein, unknown function [Plasmodium malariae]